jgi:hypothetical protein
MATNISEDSGEPLDSISALELLFGLYADKSPLIKEIHEDVQLLGTIALKIFTGLPWLMPALHQGCNFLEFYGTENLAQEKLCARTVKNVARYLKAVLFGDSATCNDISRDLMEIESILLLFAVDPNAVERWLNPNGEGRDEFGFSSIEPILKKSMGIDRGYSRPDFSEYIAHSVQLHPRVLGRMDQTPNDDHHLAILCFEISQHLLRVCLALSLVRFFSGPETATKDFNREELNNLFEADEFARNYLQEMLDELPKIGLEMPQRENGLKIFPVKDCQME